MEGPTTRELALPRVNSATRSQLTVPRSSLSLIRFAFRRRVPSHCYPGKSGLITGFLHCCRPRVRHSGEERFGNGWEPNPTVIPSAS